MTSLNKIFHRISRAQNSTITGHEWGPEQWIELGVILWMVIQASMALALALATSSVLLLAIALDSGIEVVKSSMALWRLVAISVNLSEQRERLILRITAIGLFAIASYLVKNSILMLVIGVRSGLSWWSITLAVAAVLIQPLLKQGRQRVLKGTGGVSERSESINRINAFFLPWTLLVGLLLHRLLGWWWADPLAALVVVAFLIPKGWEAIRLSSRCYVKGASCTLRETKN
jgi:divalent metal cation (Fe/Co/Zn/Cd) transporter